MPKLIAWCASLSIVAVLIFEVHHLRSEVRILRDELSRTALTTDPELLRMLRRDLKNDQELMQELDQFWAFQRENGERIRESLKEFRERFYWNQLGLFDLQARIGWIGPQTHPLDWPAYHEKTSFDYAGTALEERKDSHNTARFSAVEFLRKSGYRLLKNETDTFIFKPSDIREALAYEFSQMLLNQRRLQVFYLKQERLGEDILSGVLQEYVEFSEAVEAGRLSMLGLESGIQIFKSLMVDRILGNSDSDYLLEPHTGRTFAVDMNDAFEFLSEDFEHPLLETVLKLWGKDVDFRKAAVEFAVELEKFPEIRLKSLWDKALADSVQLTQECWASLLERKRRSSAWVRNQLALSLDKID